MVKNLKADPQDIRPRGETVLDTIRIATYAHQLKEARRLLDASVKSFGATAQLQIAGDRATVTFKGASADALAQWLLQVRLNVRAVPGEARLLRGASGNWDGTVTLNLK